MLERRLLKKNGILKLVIVIIVGLFIGVTFLLYYKPTPTFSPEETANSYFQKCKDVFDFRRCYTPLFKKLANISNIDETLATLTATQEIDPRVNNCHYIAHDITFALIKRFPEEWVKRMHSLNLSWCSTGFMHGTILKLGFDKGAFTEQISKMDQFCKDIIATQDDKRLIEDSCYHATGHVFLIENGGSVDEGLKVCNLYDTVKKRQDCAIGLFMETVQRDALIEHELAEKNSWSWEELEKQEAICKKYDPITARACWMEMWPLYKANAWRVIPKYSNLKDFQTLCSRAEDTRAQDRCYQYGIYTIIDNGLGFLSESEIRHSCDGYKDDLSRLTECIKYTAGAFIRSNAIKNTDTVSSVCSNSVPENDQNCCQYFKSSSKKQLQKDVLSIENNFESCMLKGGKLKEYHQL
jgi:hypothetical protein